MKFLNALALILASALLASASAAQDEFSRPGPYVQLAGTYAICDYTPSNGSLPDCSDYFDSSLGFNVRAGFRFNRFFSVEGQVEWLSGFDAKNPSQFDATDSQGTPYSFTQVQSESVAYTINARFYPIEGRIQPYALAGLGGENFWINTNYGQTDTMTSFVGRFGGGLDIYLTPNLALSGEFTYVVATEGKTTYYGWYNAWVNNSNIDPSYMAVSWGLTYRF